MALNPDEHRKINTFEGLSLGEAIEFPRHRHVRPETTETLQDLGKEYQQRFAKLAPYRESVWQVLVREFFQQYVSSGSSVLDLGSGWGEFIRHIQAERRIAMDLNPDMPSRVGPGWKRFYKIARRLGSLSRRRLM